MKEATTPIPAVVAAVRDPVRSPPGRTWRGALTACLQDFARYEFLVRETVGAGRLPAIGDTTAVRSAIAAAGADDVVDSLTSDIETQLGTRWDGGADLSTGQWQKLALGRAMMRPLPRLLLLDEPTAALDALAEARLFERYAAASEFARASGSITIIVSQRMSTVRMADQIAVIEDGRLRQYGTPDSLVAVSGPYQELFQTQVAAYASWSALWGLRLAHMLGEWIGARRWSCLTRSSAGWNRALAAILALTMLQPEYGRSNPRPR